MGMDLSFIALSITTISFVLFFIYYGWEKPEYVCIKEKFSLRLSVIYALLFSSAFGLFSLCALLSYERLYPTSDVTLSIEQPTFKTKS
jgi:multisubunit Na+/H+ antiporter MnhB subunit